MSRVPPPSAGRLLGSWTFDPVVVAILLAIALLYLVGTRRARRGWPPARTACFLGGLAMLAAALCSGIDTYSDHLLSIHMVQHLLLMLGAPVLLLLGSPMRLAFAAASPHQRRLLGAWLRSRPLGVLTRPIVGLAAFAFVVWGTHFTGFFELALRNQTWHDLEHAGYFWSGLLCLAPLVGSDPLPRRPGPLARFSWLMGVMTVMAVPGAILTFYPHLMYPYYAGPARMLGVSALIDQADAGSIMWIGGGLAGFAIALAVVMRGILAEERRALRRERYAPPPELPALIDIDHRLGAS